MYVVILGAGRVGTQLARQLILEKKDVAIIEQDAERAREVGTKLDCLVINEKGNAIEELIKAGIQKADVFVSVADSDETNLIACGLVAAEFSSVKTVARVRSLNYSKTKFLSSSFLGIDHVISPEIEAAKIISYAVSHGVRSDIMLFENARLQMRNLTIHGDSIFLDQSLKTLRGKLDFSFLIAAILRKEGYLIPTGDTTIKEGDEIYLVSSEEDLETIFELEKNQKEELNRITIIGGGRISAYVAEELLGGEGSRQKGLGFLKLFGKKQKKKTLQIIDKDYERCQALAERFPQALITHADVTEDRFSEDELLKDTDLIITTTRNQELNLITGIYAKTLGVQKTMALVVRNSYRNMAHNLNIDMTVSLNDSVTNSILKVLRRGSVKNVHALSGGKLEVMEFEIDMESPIAGKQIAQIKLPPNSLIIFLSHKGEDIIPTGMTRIEGGDFVVIILERSYVSQIEKVICG